MNLRVIWLCIFSGCVCGMIRLRIVWLWCSVSWVGLVVWLIC